MNILVVDDNHQHLIATSSLSEKHHVTVTDSYERATEIINFGDVDVLLTDLLMPAEAGKLGPTGMNYLGHEIPIGLVLAIRAAQTGIKYVAVVTDTNHHDHPMSAAVDWISYQDQKGQSHFFIEKTKTIVTHAPMKDGVKDWDVVLAMLLD